MKKYNLASILLIIAVIATILPPGHHAYIGSYITLVAALLAVAIYGWRERAVFSDPASCAILVAIALVAATIPFVYHSPQDLTAPILLLPMLTTIAFGLLARPAKSVPSPTIFATLCLAAVLIALIGGAYERFTLGIYRPGLGNNPIHYASLAAMAGSLSMIGAASGRSAWRYLFLLGPVFGLCCAVIADSRGPMLGALAMTAVGGLVLLAWLWHERLFRFAFLTIAALGTGGVVFLIESGNSRVAGLMNSALNIFRFTGGSDDIRAALYGSALEVLRTSPIVGVGLGQIMLTAQQLYPEQGEVFTLDNLHADWANFAAMAGGMGLVAYFMLVMAPLLLLLDHRARADRPVVIGAILLVTGQITLGISNAMFGILPQTMIYAVSTGYLFVRTRRLPTSL